MKYNTANVALKRQTIEVKLNVALHTSYLLLFSLHGAKYGHMCLWSAVIKKINFLYFFKISLCGSLVEQTVWVNLTLREGVYVLKYAYD